MKVIKGARVSVICESEIQMLRHTVQLVKIIHFEMKIVLLNPKFRESLTASCF